MIENERAWALINLDNIRHNYLQIKKNANAEVMAIIKADAYGHGGFEVAKTLSESGAKYFGVATCDEGINLKNINANILILGFTPKNKLQTVIENDLEQTVFDFETAKKLSNIATKIKKQARIQIKIDTGMHRLGFEPTLETIETIKKINLLPNIIITGIFSHLAQSDIPNNKFTYEQYEKFKYVTQNLSQIKMIRHIANSCAILNYPEFKMDMVRTGLMLYGISPFENNILDLKPAMSLKSQISCIKELNIGEGISYNRKFIADRKTKVGIVVIGYADGYPRSCSNKANVIINGKYAPVIGNVCMDYLMINLNGIDAKIGDEVILIGEQNNLSVSADDIAKINNTISYEIITSIGKRIPRYYMNNTF